MLHFQETKPIAGPLQQALCCPHVSQLGRNIDQADLMNKESLCAIVLSQNSTVFVQQQSVRVVFDAAIMHNGRCARALEVSGRCIVLHPLVGRRTRYVPVPPAFNVIAYWRA